MNKIEIHKFRKLAKKNKKQIYSLNNGGCICFAYIMATHLEHLNINYEVIAFNDNPIIWFHKYLLKLYVKYNLINWVGFTHVMVKVDDWYIDGYNIFHKDNIKKEQVKKFGALFSTKLNFTQLSYVIVMVIGMLNMIEIKTIKYF